jgi:hypothetical protein
MQRLIIFLSLFATLSAEEAGHDPIVHWNRDPAESCEIFWLERSGEDGMEGKWASGPAGFGYGDEDDSTVFPGMKGRFLSIAIRRHVKHPPGVPGDAELVLRVNYDDGFIAWLGGKEIARRNIAPNGARADSSHEAGEWEEILLGRMDRLLGQDGAVIALRGFNHELGSSDFTLQPALIARRGREEWPVTTAAESWEYLANAEPENRWQNQTASLEDEKSSEGFQIAWRVKNTGSWESRPVATAPFADSNHRVHRATLASLPAGKDIEFRISRNGGGESADFAFRMPPEDAGAVRFVTGGDVYHKRGAMDKMNRVAGAQDPLFALIGGDLAYANNASFDRWFDYLSSWSRCARTPDGRLVPKVVAIGNHEIIGAGYHPTDAPGPEAASMFYSLFAFPESNNATHAVDFGDRLSILNLDSGHTKNIAAQNGWLEENLKARADVPNLFVCYHRPAYGAGAKPDAVDIQREWCPLFEKHRVTAVFENDHHVFSRSHPIKAGVIDEKEGVPYLGSGSWSVNVRPINPKEIATRPWIAHAEARNHLYLIETLPQGGYAATAKDIEGVEFDRSRREWKR